MTYHRRPCRRCGGPKHERYVWYCPTCSPLVIDDRIMAKVTVTPTQCWLYSGPKNPGGYGLITRHRGQPAVIVHRYLYERMVGPIPEGLTLDHLCRVRNCVNPAHLEPVTIRENIARGFSPSALNARKTHCHQGHEFSAENTYVHRGKRGCRICRRTYKREAYQRLVAAGLGGRRGR